MKSTNNQDHESPYYDRETLYREVWEEPMIHVAQRYGVSNVALTVDARIIIPTMTAQFLRNSLYH